MKIGEYVIEFSRLDRLFDTGYINVFVIKNLLGIEILNLKLDDEQVFTLYDHFSILYDPGLPFNLPLSNIDSEYYISGFMDSEESFIISIETIQYNSINKNISLKFSTTDYELFSEYFYEEIIL